MASNLELKDKKTQIIESNLTSSPSTTPSTEKKSSPSPEEKPKQAAEKNPKAVETKASTPVVKDRVTLEIKEKFKCSSMDLFTSFVDKNKVAIYSGDQTKISPEPGYQFSLFGGHVSGENLEIVRKNANLY